LVIEIKDKLWKTDMLSLYGDSQYVIASANGMNNMSSLMLQHLKSSVLTLMTGICDTHLL